MTTSFWSIRDCLDIDCDSRLEVNGEVVLEYRDLGNKPFDQCFIKFCDGGGKIREKVATVEEVLWLSKS